MEIIRNVLVTKLIL